MERHPDEVADPGLTPAGVTKNMLLSNLSDHAIELVDFEVPSLT
jgi:hypothetical protein